MISLSLVSMTALLAYLAWQQSPRVLVLPQVIAKEGLESASNVPTLVADDSLVIAAEQLRQKFAAHFPGGYCPYPNGRYSRL